MPDYYKILEIHPDASREVIEKAYKALSAKYHPDRQPAEKRVWATRKMQELNEAYFVLSDPVRRQEYANQKKVKLWQIWWENGLVGLFKIWRER